MVVPALSLAVLGYVSLRQWQTSSEALFVEQSRGMAAMVADKVALALRHADYELLGRLEAALRSGPAVRERLEAVLATTPLARRLYVVAPDGRVVFPEAAGLVVPPELRAVLESPDRWPPGGKRYLVAGEEVVLAAVVKAGATESHLVAVVRDAAALRREILDRTLGGLETSVLVAVTDHRGRAVFARDGVEGAEAVASVPLGETLPSWHLGLYQLADLSPRVAVRRQMTLFTAAFGLLLLVIGVGLYATFRVVRRETDMARLKADFVANVSHDLKTPLSVIRVYGETLEMGRVPDETTRQEYYRVITHESERLSRLIDNVLDFSRIESGRRPYEVAPTAVEPLVRDTLEAFGYVATQEGFKVDVRVEPNLPEVPLDADAVSQALGNLVDNAIKYSAERKTLAVTAAIVDGHLALSVADEGIGIPGDEQTRIFEKFYRIGRSETQGRRGSGMGLALVRHVAEAHGGRVTVDSQPGEGSRFTLWLPLRRSG